MTRWYKVRTNTAVVTLTGTVKARGVKDAQRKFLRLIRSHCELLLQESHGDVLLAVDFDRLTAEQIIAEPELLKEG